MSSTDAVRDILVHEQERQDMTDAEFAATIGMSTPGWNLWKNGKRRPRVETLQAAVRAYPAVWNPLLALFLPADASIAPSDASDDNSETVEATG